MAELGVNIDHIATVREARYRGCGAGEPDVLQAAKVVMSSGAHSITVHLREDRRHIQDRDVWALREELTTRINLEMANVPEIVDVALRLKPEIICLVPEKRQEVTTEGGLDVVGQQDTLKTLCARFANAGILVSMFINPDPEQVRASASVGAPFIELHTGTFADHFLNPLRRASELRRLADSTRLAHDLGLRVNAGHGLNYENVSALTSIPGLVELNIGHSIVSRAVFTGLSEAVREMALLAAALP